MSRMTKAKEQEQQEAREALREIVKPGDTLHTVLRHTSGSGMTRWIDVYLFACEDGKASKRWLSGLLARAGVADFDTRRDCLKVPGAGMDMGFHVVYTAGRVLWRDGFECIGTDCNANDHSNPPHPARVAGSMTHGDGGYALNQQWL